MKFFIDTANVKEIREAWSLGVIDGVTTNPSLISKEKRDANEVIKEISSVINGPISMEVVSRDAAGMIKEAERISGIARNIVVKVPMTVEGIKAVKVLNKKGIRTNVTLVFSPLQGIIAAKAGANFISPFVGRLDDISHNGMEMVGTLIKILRNYRYTSEIIVASIRHPLHIIKAGEIGVDIVTVPYRVLEQMFNHPLTDIGLEKFLKDWEAYQKEKK